MLTWMLLSCRELEQEFRGKLAVMKNEVEIERELLMQQANHQRTKLEADIKSLQGEESGLREKLTLVIKVRIQSLC